MRIGPKKFLSLIFLLLLVAGMPAAVWLARQETRTRGRAYFPQPETVFLEEEYGGAAVGEPAVLLVWPFLGKVGDSVLVYGLNLGDNPKEKQLRLGERLVNEEFINQWTDELIEFVLPPGSVSGLIDLSVGEKETVWEFPFTVYDLETQVQVTEEDGVVKVKNSPERLEMTVYFQSGEKLTVEDHREGLVYPEEEKIVSVLLKDEAGGQVPFWVEPSEFGF